MSKSFYFSLFLVFSINISAEPMDHMDHMDHMKNHSAKMHGPIGLMGDHFHRKGESMISIRYMKMYMNHNYLGTNKLMDLNILELPNPTGMPKNCLLYTSDAADE